VALFVGYLFYSHDQIATMRQQIEAVRHPPAQIGGQNCDTVYKCSNVAVAQAAAARDALEKSKIDLDGLSGELKRVQETFGWKNSKAE
jgi:hypothetical protein